MCFWLPNLWSTVTLTGVVSSEVCVDCACGNTISLTLRSFTLCMCICKRVWGCTFACPWKASRFGQRSICVRKQRSITFWKESNLRDTIVTLEGRRERKTETVAYVYQNNGFSRGISIYFHHSLWKDTAQTWNLFFFFLFQSSKEIDIKNIYIHGDLSTWLQ